MVKKFQAVLAFGDSHVAGCELSNTYSLEDYTSGKKTLEECDAPGKELAFPKIIADHLNIPCYNYAMTGGSNARSIRQLVSAVQEHPNSLVLFGYTCTDRQEFYFPDWGNYLRRDSDKFLQVGMQWNSLSNKGKLENPINDMFVNEILRPYNNLKDLAFIVDSLCTLNAFKHYHLPLFPESFPEIEDRFDFEGHENYLDWCASNRFKRLPYLHYDIKAHTKLAELIIKDLGA